MGATLSLLKTLVIPALISLILYVIVSFVIVPVWKRYRVRYSQYLPIESISTRTSSLRQRTQDAIARFILPSAWTAEYRQHRYPLSAEDGFGSELGDNEGEELFEVDDNRREALSLDARRGRDIDDRRLSRDLEEGFKDDSDEDEPDERQGRSALR
ncbi:hypothetical protein PVAG01_02539 [Phlyctema vagabunda]|uniref:Uncharacterized protein n=1 Tax=Phlyctema vagabunda TaxID=108571 RepID=A0ABR4PQV7_9HELO